MTGRPDLVPWRHGAPSGGERRAAARRPCDEEIPLRPLSPGGGVERWACVQNLSRTGVGLLLSYPFEPGTVVSIKLRRRPPEGPRPVVGRVVHTHTGPHGITYMGCAFVRALSPEEERQVG
jgi:PilZ domain